jgi:hypothetical protein
MSPSIDDAELILAAEDCDRTLFPKIHSFSRNDNRIINKILAHGPVLLQGGRGSGKSALMIAATQEMALTNPTADVFGVYLSLRNLPLLRSEGAAYERIFCDLLIDEIRRQAEILHASFESEPDVRSLQYAIAEFSRRIGKRIVLLFDDAAHIGREASLEEFFSLFRTLSSSTVSCKATIYPGVTNFGTRFDVFNDATVIDVTRDEEQVGFAELFADIVEARYPTLVEAEYVGGLDYKRVAKFLGLCVLGNMRGFIFACGRLQSKADAVIGLTTLSDTILFLAHNYYWPLLDEVTPKLGKYRPMVEPAKEIADQLIKDCANAKPFRKSVLVHRDLIAKMPKPFEILEYVGFISRREASRSMKSGGRGTRFVVNLCLLFEEIPGSRLTNEVYLRLENDRPDPFEIHITGKMAKISVPQPSSEVELKILGESVSCLKKSNAYPYGLTPRMIVSLRGIGVKTVKDLSETSDAELDEIDRVGTATIKRIRNVVGQAVWM